MFIDILSTVYFIMRSNKFFLKKMDYQVLEYHENA